jgi:ABC-2 type transport system permease protein
MLRYLIEKEFKQFIRNSFLPKLVMVIPLVATLIFPLVATFDVKNIRITLVDLDKSKASMELTQKIASSNYFLINAATNSNKLAFDDVEIGNSDIILESPPKFNSEISKNKSTQILMSVNAVNGVRGSIGASYLNAILSEFETDYRPQLNGGKIDVVASYKYNPGLAYPIFMIPALMIMVLSMITGFLPALNIVEEKQKGTMEQLNVTPLKKSTFILAKLIPYWIIGYIVLTICILVGRLAYGLIPQGSLLLVYLFATLFILAYSGFGLVLSNYAKTIQQAMFMMFFFVLTFVFMSGLFTPIENMPHWAQLFSNISPLKYIMQSVRAIFIKGASIHELLPQLKWLIGMVIFSNTWAILSYRKKSN